MIDKFEEIIAAVASVMCVSERIMLMRSYRSYRFAMLMITSVAKNYGIDVEKMCERLDITQKEAQDYKDEIADVEVTQKFSERKVEVMCLLQKMEDDESDEYDLVGGTLLKKETSQLGWKWSEWDEIRMNIAKRSAMMFMRSYGLSY
jgi:hypothetical protein